MVDHRFIPPDESLRALDIDTLRARMGLEIRSGHRANFGGCKGQNFLLDRVIGRLQTFTAGYEDQCSVQYYADLFTLIRNCYGEVTRIVEVGVYMGGASALLYGCAEVFGLELDLIDIDANCLQFTHERIRRTYGDPGRVRLYHGDLPHYVRDVLGAESGVKAMVQHDGSHFFQQVILDLGSLYYQRDKIHSLAIQDTNLRGNPRGCRFIDAAVRSIFGQNLSFMPIGTAYKASQEVMTRPNAFGGNYFLPDAPEGMFVPMHGNRFEYPHPEIPFHKFFPDEPAP